MPIPGLEDLSTDPEERERSGIPGLEDLAAEGEPAEVSGMDADGFGPPPSPEERPDLYEPAPPVPPSVEEIRAEGLPGGATGAGFLGGGQGLSLGHLDELAGLASAWLPGNLESPDPQLPPVTYEQERDRFRNVLDAYSEEHPAASTAGEIGGGVAGVLMAPGVSRGTQIPYAAPEGAGVFGRIGAGLRHTGRQALQDLRDLPRTALGQLAEGAGWGALAGEGYSEAELGDPALVEDMATGGTIGGVTGVGAQALRAFERPAAVVGAMTLLANAGLDPVQILESAGVVGVYKMAKMVAGKLGQGSVLTPAPVVEGVRAIGRTVAPSWFATDAEDVDVELPDVSQIDVGPAQVTPLLPPEEMPPEALEGIDWDSLAALGGAGAGAGMAAMYTPAIRPPLLEGDIDIPRIPALPPAEGLLRAQEEGARRVEAMDARQARIEEQGRMIRLGMPPQAVDDLRVLEAARARAAGAPPGRPIAVKLPDGIVKASPESILAEVDEAIARLRPQTPPPPRRPTIPPTEGYVPPPDVATPVRQRVEGEISADRTQRWRDWLSSEYDAIHAWQREHSPTAAPAEASGAPTAAPREPVHTPSRGPTAPGGLGRLARGARGAGVGLLAGLAGSEIVDALMGAPAQAQAPREASVDIGPVTIANAPAIDPERGDQVPSETGALGRLWDVGTAVYDSMSDQPDRGVDALARDAPRLAEAFDARDYVGALDVMLPGLREGLDAGAGWDLRAMQEEARERADRERAAAVPIEIGQVRMLRSPSDIESALASGRGPDALGPWWKDFANARSIDPERGVAVQYNKLQQSDPAFRAWTRAQEAGP